CAANAGAWVCSQARRAGLRDGAEPWSEAFGARVLQRPTSSCLVRRWRSTSSRPDNPDARATVYIPAPTGRAGTAETSRSTRTARVYESPAAGSERDRQLVRGNVCLGRVRPRELGRALPAASGELVAQRVVAEQTLKRVGASLDVAGREQQPGRP